MRIKFIVSIIALILTLNCIAQVHVSGYYRKNGTYVQPHYRSSPDGIPYNNWSYPGNTNPYTGKVATGNADAYLDNYYNSNSTSRSYSTTLTSSYPTSSSSTGNYYPSTSTSSINNSKSNSTITFIGNADSSRYSTSTTAETVNVNNIDMAIEISNLTTQSRQYYISTLKANLRLGPTIHSSALEQLDFGSKIYLIESFDKYWSKVLYELKNEFDGKHFVIGYINTKFINSNQNTTAKSTSTELESEPEKLVRDFLTDLGNRNFYSAYLKSKNPTWKTFEWFSSTSAYGGIDKVDIYEVKLENIFINEAIVYARYYANDPINTSGTYKQIFIVKLIDNSWKITRVKLVDK